jgi:ATP-binding cassette subfamily B protein RaxB
VGNERAVTLTLGGMRLTRLVIAHRPETIAGAQRVVQIRDGQVAEVMQAVPRPAQPTAPMPA